MRKEQIFLVVGIGVAGLLVWGATGKYDDIGVGSIPAGKDVPVVDADRPDTTKGLTDKGLSGRPLWAQVRPEKRPALPPLPAPAVLPLWWVRLVTTPGPAAGAWRSFRTVLVPATVEEAAATPPAETPAADDPGLPQAKKFNPAKAARMVQVGGGEVVCRVEPSGPFKGQPDWVILEKWPNVQFFLIYLNKETGKEQGRVELVGPDALQNYSTVHLSKSLLNEFHEERINRKVKDTDREGLQKLAQWVFDSLRNNSGDDDVAYGLGAVRLAVETMNKAKAAGANDLPFTRQLAEYCRAAYDLEGELRVSLDYLNAGHTNETGAQLLAADAYERNGAYEAAGSLFAKAAQAGDNEARLRIGLLAEKKGEFDEAKAALQQVANAPAVGGRALAALARIALRRGNVAEASTLAEQAKKEGVTPELNLVLGAVLYAQGKFADAEKVFAAAKVDDRHSVWRSDRAMALVGADKLDEAKKEFYACLEQDPLNLVDPLAGLGDVFQRSGQVQRSNDAFETALARSPDDRWLLLRVATTRLRDGQAEKALALGLRLLDVAPDCVEGLWLVGRSAGALPTPDHDKAAKYLKRAVGKEPDNKELVNDYVRELIAAGRTEDALREVEAAVDVRSGVGRSDGKLLALASWVRFLAKRPVTEVFEVIERGKRAQLDDQTKEWLTTVRRLLDEWDRTRIWEDSFDRQASANVGNGWTESDQANGISFALDGASHLVIAGNPVKQAAATRDTATRLHRQEDLGRFRMAEFTFTAQSGVELVAHLFSGPLADREAGGAAGGGGRRGVSGGAEIGLGCDRNGLMVLWVPGGKGNLAKEIPVKDAAGNPRPWPMDEPHTVKILRKDDTKGIYEIWLDDEKMVGLDGKGTTFEVGALSGQTGKSVGIGLLVDADGGANIKATVDSVKVTKINK